MRSVEGWEVHLKGCVQGVGFRPTVYRLAQRMKQKGQVENTAGGVRLKLAGSEAVVQGFLSALQASLPPEARVQEIDLHPCMIPDGDCFRIVPTPAAGTGRPDTLMPQDGAPCATCVHEFFDPANRRHLFPFISCCDCGPRYSIAERLPFERENTSYRDFPLCKDCHQEFSDPSDRRFFAQTLSCGACGPKLSFRESGGTIEEHEGLWQRVVRLLAADEVIALQGVGGFQYLVRADSSRAVQALRAIKRRACKPFAVMFASEMEIGRSAHCGPLERKALQSREAPIVLLQRKVDGCFLAPEVAFGMGTLGAFLPSSPLHLRLFHEIAHHMGSKNTFPLVVTSANQSSEPMALDEKVLFPHLESGLSGILSHSRRIVRRLDDGVLRVIGGKVVPFRLGRGQLPRIVHLPLNDESPFPPLSAGAPAVWAAGTYLKAVPALRQRRQLAVTHFVGGMGSAANQSAYMEVVQDQQELSGLQPSHVLLEEHPDTMALQKELVAAAQGHSPACPGIRVQTIPHHLAHVFSVIAEHPPSQPFLGVAWDGYGWGTAGESWGGEFFAGSGSLADGYRMERIGSFLPFSLLGGDSAARDPRRVALSLAWQCRFAPGSTLADPQHEIWRTLRNKFTKFEWSMFQQMLQRPQERFHRCSSVGRIFDAAGSVLGGIDKIQYEGQAAQLVESWAESESDFSPYAIDLRVQQEEESSGADPAQKIWHVDWRQAWMDFLEGNLRGEPRALLSARLHDTLVQAIVMVAQRWRFELVLVSGGVFQNRLLTERLETQLARRGVGLQRNGQVPPNDSGVAIGQLMADYCWKGG